MVGWMKMQTQPPLPRKQRDFQQHLSLPVSGEGIVRVVELNEHL